MQQAHITVITAGGTIDKDYGTGIGVRDLHIGPPVAKDFLPRRFPQLVFHFVEVFRKDNLDMKKRDREAVVDACREANTGRIIITHGADTMLKTAGMIRHDGIARRRVIVMTGALRPASMKVTDAFENLELAVKAILDRRENVFVAMNGNVYPSVACKKDETGRFVLKTGRKLAVAA